MKSLSNSNFQTTKIAFPQTTAPMQTKELDPTTRYATWKKYTATVQKTGCISKWTNTQGQHPKQLYRVWLRKINVQVYSPSLEIKTELDCMAYIQRMTISLQSKCYLHSTIIFKNTQVHSICRIRTSYKLLNWVHGEFIRWIWNFPW